MPASKRLVARCAFCGRRRVLWAIGWLYGCSPCVATVMLMRGPYHG